LAGGYLQDHLRLPGDQLAGGRVAVEYLTRPNRVVVLHLRPGGEPEGQKLRPGDSGVQTFQVGHGERVGPGRHEDGDVGALADSALPGRFGAHHAPGGNVLTGDVAEARVEPGIEQPGLGLGLGQADHRRDLGGSQQVDQEDQQRHHHQKRELDHPRRDDRNLLVPPVDPDRWAVFDLSLDREHPHLRWSEPLFLAGRHLHAGDFVVSGVDR
jgi:hypothetical protein